MTGRKRTAAALAVATGIMLSRIAGLVRDRVFAYYLGNSVAAGAFKAALRIPNLLQNLFGEGVLSASFIPVYAKLRAEGKDSDAVRVASAVATLLAATVTVIAALGTLGAPWLIDLLAPGFSGDVRALTVRIVQIMFPGVALLVLSAWCLGVLNSHRRFLLSYTAPVLWNVAIIAALLGFGGSRMETSDGQMDLVRIIAWGTVVGALLQLCVQLPTALKLTHGLRPRLALRDTQVRTVLRNFGPVVLSRGVVQISAYIDQVIASFLGASMVAAMAYAQTLYLLPVALFGMSISAAELPAMSAVTGSETAVKNQLKEKLVRALQRVSYFVIPSVVAMSLLGDIVIASLYQTGQFKDSDVQAVWIILVGSTVGLLASTQGRLCSTAFYALRDTRKPLLFALLRVSITGVAGYLLALPLRATFGYSVVLGAAALTASAGVAGWIEFVLLRRALGRLIGDFFVGTALLLRLWAVALVAGALARALNWLLPPLYPALTGVLVLGVFGGIYLAVTTVQRWGEGAHWHEALARRMGRSRA